MVTAGFLVDTNVISELMRKEPDPSVLSWASAVRRVGMSVITLEEIQFGIAWKPHPRVIDWLETFLDDYVELFPVTAGIARRAGALRGEFRAKGVVRTQADLLIAATAAEHGLSLVSRNTRDFEGCAVALLNPFTG